MTCQNHEQRIKELESDLDKREQVINEMRTERQDLYAIINQLKANLTTKRGFSISIGTASTDPNSYEDYFFRY